MFTIGKWKLEIKKEWKIAFIATWIVGLLAHAYRFFNFLPIWDSIYNFTGVGSTYALGRWFLPYAGLISSIFDLPWVNGALSLLYISIVMILLIEMFQIRNKGLIVVSAAVFASFPTVVSTFAYMYTADCYMLAFLLAVLAIFLTWRVKKWGMPLGIVALAFAMGIYQAYATCAIMMVLLYIIKQFAVEKMSLIDAIKKDLKYLGTLVGGLVLYLIILKLTLWHYNMNLVGYQGIGDMGIMSLAEYKAALLKTKARFTYMLGLEYGIINRPYTIINVAILVMIAVLLVYFVVKNRVFEKKLSLLALVVAVMLLPVGAYTVFFISPSVEYYTLMEMGLCFLYFLLIVLLNQIEWKAYLPKLLSVIGTVAICALAYYNVLNSNIAYYNLNLSYHKSYAVAENILDRIEDREEFGTVTKKVAMIGVYECPTENLISMVPAIMGISDDSFLNDPNHYQIFWNYCFGIQTELATYDEMHAIMETEEYKNMPIYPAKGSVQCINDIIVVRLSE